MAQKRRVEILFAGGLLIVALLVVTTPVVADGPVCWEAELSRDLTLGECLGQVFNCSNSEKGDRIRVEVPSPDYSDGCYYSGCGFTMARYPCDAVRLLEPVESEPTSTPRPTDTPRPTVTPFRPTPTPRGPTHEELVAQEWEKACQVLGLSLYNPYRQVCYNAASVFDCLVAKIATPTPKPTATPVPPTQKPILPSSTAVLVRATAPRESGGSSQRDGATGLGALSCLVFLIGLFALFFSVPAIGQRLAGDHSVTPRTRPQPELSWQPAPSAPPGAENWRPVVTSPQVEIPRVPSPEPRPVPKPGPSTPVPQPSSFAPLAEEKAGLNQAGQIQETDRPSRPSGTSTASAMWRRKKFTGR